MLPTDKQIKQSLATGLTQSELMCRCNCPRKWMFRYILNLKRQSSFSWPLVMGSAIHKLLEMSYHGRLKEPTTIDFDFEPDVLLNPIQEEEYKYYKMVAAMLVWRHNQHYKEFDEKLEIESIEYEINYEYRGFRLRGMIDLAGYGSNRPGLWIMDHKSTGDINDKILEGWNFRFQFLFYAWLWTRVSGQRPTGIFVNMLKKPLERRSVKKQESLGEFIRRIDNNIQIDPQSYFRREWIPLDDATIERFQNWTLDPLITEMHMLQEAVSGDSYERFNQVEKEAMLLRANTDHCLGPYHNFPCEFLELCKNDFNDYASEYIQREHKHPELSSTNGE